LEGCYIVFSGVIPTNVRPDASEIWKQAETFGATPQSSISHNTTHCVIGLEGTEKALKAQKMGIKVVWVAWFQQCVALWERLNEENWLVRSSKKGLQGVETRPSSESSTPNASGLQLSADDAGSQEYEERPAKERGDGAESGEVGDAWDDDEFLASIRAEAGLDDDVSDVGTEDGTDRPR
jgi:RNA polymerase II subunit A-like phosphatase